jgi:hypothetical protein
MRARLRQEARAAAALSHPSIATVFALEEIGDQLFIASEYVPGRTLREELRVRRPDRAQALALATNIAGALAAAHERGIVHRDLKPENIMLTGSGAVKVVDFGLAHFDVAAQDLQSVTRLTDPGVFAGTPPYMAPEQLLGNATSTRTDQFAFGVLLYELLTGRHPFGSGALPTTIARVLASELDPADIPEPLWSIITRATQKNPEDRFPTTGDLVQALGTAPGTGIGHLPVGTYGTQGTNGTADGRGWWEIHQLVVALAYWAMVYSAWHVRAWTGRYGVLLFLATLAIVIVGGNIRLHLWFTSRTYPGELAAQRAEIGVWLRMADIGFSLIMVATGLLIVQEHNGWGALFVSFGLGAALAFLIIEPTTARATFEPRMTDISRR